MKITLLILAVFLCGFAAALIDEDGEIDIDVSTIKPPNKKAKPTPTVSGDGEDGEEGSAIQGDSSGSGSGDEAVPTTIIPTEKVTITKELTKAPEVSTRKPKPKDRKTKEPKVETEEVEITTAEPVKPTEKPTEFVKPTTEDDVMETDPENPKEGDMQARVSEKKRLKVLTNEVIAAVVVGGVCAIILIAFLVYRLRKRDEGSYALTDNAYKDTNKLRGDPGKEAFV
ncbi:syndecan-2 [Nematostella vectensis]|uniref:syndecan-2 n=1 Tax=Nematostella vectensis TaxID=45351 RepID=UPI00138FAE7D|nr:syndecan-2 [Nematostella vectensis]